MNSIRFGTDGWRGIIAEDFTFANACIVAEAIARYVVRGEDARKGVIVGYDHRYAADAVARQVAEVFSSMGTPVWLTDRPCPTPAVSYLVRERAAAGLLQDLCQRHGIQRDAVRGTRDPRLGGARHQPIEPDIAPLQRAVTAGKYDAGFAADGDGDRIGAVDRAGTFVNPHQIFSLLVWHLAGMRDLPGDIAKTFSVTKLIDKLAAKLGRKVHEVPIGFKYICELMLEQDILIGGEESGGIGTSLYLPERDATVSALFLAELMAWHGKELAELLAGLHKEFGEHHYGRVDLDVTPKQKEQAIAWFSDGDAKKILEWPVVRNETIDGIKLYLGEIGWVMVRASGTENLLRVYAENSEKEATRRVLKAVCERIVKL